MSHLILFFIVLGIIVLAMIFRNSYSWPGQPRCEKQNIIPIEDHLKVPKPILPNNKISEEWNTTSIIVNWSCDFSNSKYDPEDVYFRLDTSQNSFSQTWLYSYSDAIVGKNQDTYNYQITINSTNGFQQGGYKSVLYAYLRDSRVNPDPETRLNSKTTSHSKFTVVIGTCVSSCGTATCGDDNCGNTNACGVCGDGTICQNGQCVTPPCVPTCNGSNCGPDNCGNPNGCGVCSNGYTCQSGKCTCTPKCDGLNCGDDGCGNPNGCGSCPSGYTCQGGQCVCVPQCGSSKCGVDSCGNPNGCGTCQSGYVCQNGQCIIDQTCVCEDGDCGVNSCGVDCGQCTDPSKPYCSNNKCVECVWGEDYQCPKFYTCSPYNTCVNFDEYCECDNSPSASTVICSCFQGPAMYLRVYQGCFDTPAKFETHGLKGTTDKIPDNQFVTTGGTIRGFNYEMLTNYNGSNYILNNSNKIDTFLLSYDSMASNQKIVWTQSSAYNQGGTYASKDGSRRLWGGFMNTYSLSFNDQCGLNLTKWPGTISATDYSGNLITPPDSITFSPGDTLTLTLVINGISTTRVYHF